MKKTLLYLFLCLCTSAFSQLLQSDNFNNLTVGNVGTDITGVTAGQDGWLTFSTNGADPTTSTNASNANFQISANGNTSSKGLLFQGPNGDKGSRFMWKSGLTTAWNARTSGNNILEVEYDFYTGSATTSTAQSGIRLFGADGASSRVLCGYVYNSNTRILQGVAYLDNAGTFGTFLITLQTGGLVLNANTWYRVGFGYDTTTGEPYWKFDSNPSVSVNPANFSGPFVPEEVDFVMAVPTTNTVSTNMIFDNYIAKASNTDTLLSIDSNVIENNTFTIYPNPTSSILNISNPINVEIKSISVVDINGRIVKNQSDSLSQINVSDLNAGVYFVTIEAAEGKTTKKFIKQ
jgi:hypothetical protein